MKKLIINMWKCFTHYKQWRNARVLDKAAVYLWNSGGIKKRNIAYNLEDYSKEIWDRILS